MTMSDFIMLDLLEKKIVLLHEGVLIGKRKTPEAMVFLFQVDYFYVESYCDMDTKEVMMYSVFIHMHMLHPYLEHIAIDDAFSG